MRQNIRKALRALESGTTMRDGSVSCDGTTIFSYATAIATLASASLLVLNVTQYSNTTTQLQHGIASAWPSAMIERVDDLDRGVNATTLVAHAMRQKVQLVQTLEAAAIAA